MTMALGVNAVGHIGGSSTSVTSASVTTAASGSGILLATNGKGGVPTNVRDSKSNSWTQLGSTVNYNFAGNWGSLWYCLNATGGAGHTFSFDQGGFADASVLAQEITTTVGLGLATDNVGVAGIERSASPFTSNSLTSVSANAALIAFLAGDSPSNPATHAVSGGSFAITADVNNGSLGTVIGAMAAFIASAVQTSLVASFTEAGNTVDATVFIASFKEAVAGGSTFPPLPGLGPTHQINNTLLRMRGHQRPPMHCSREFAREGVLVPSRKIFLPSYIRN